MNKYVYNLNYKKSPVWSVVHGSNSMYYMALDQETVKL